MLQARRGIRLDLHMWFKSLERGEFPDFPSLVLTAISYLFQLCVSLCVCVCVSASVCASEAHLVAGLLVQRDRRVIMGALDWLPVKYWGLPGEETVQLWHIRTHTRTNQIRPLHSLWSVEYCLSHSLGDSDSGITSYIYRCQSSSDLLCVSWLWFLYFRFICVLPK